MLSPSSVGIIVQWSYGATIQSGVFSQGFILGQGGLQGHAVFCPIGIVERHFLLSSAVLAMRLEVVIGD